MKYAPLLWAGMWRKPGRTILIFLQVCVAFALFGILQGLKSGLENLVAQARADLLIVHGKLGFADPIPVGYLERIRSVPDVRIAIAVDLLGGTYQKPDQQVGVVAIRPDDHWLDAFTFDVSPAQEAAFRKTRTGILIREHLQKQYGWKVGDHIPLKVSTPQKNGSHDWTFDVVGTYTDTDVGGGKDTILINYDYLDEARATGKGLVHHFNVATSTPAAAIAVADEIDRRFANSSNETRTESLRELAQQSLQSLGDLDFLIHAIVSAVLVALLFAIATMMMQSTRERVAELAVLKTLGFTDAAVFAFMVIESILVCTTAAACGLLLATLIFPLASRIIPGLSMPLAVALIGLSASVIMAVVSAAIPAAQAARLKIVTALAAR